MLPLDTLFCKSCGHCINSVLRKTYLSLSYTDPSISMPCSRSVFSLRGPNVQRNNNLLFNDVYEKSDLMSFRSKRFSYFKIKQWKCLALTESKVPSSMDRTHVLIYSFEVLFCHTISGLNKERSFWFNLNISLTSENKILKRTMK